MFSFRNLLTAPVLALILAGCGGAELPSQSSSDSGSGDSGTTEETTVGGRASKGILQSASVDAYALEQGNRRHLDSTLTDDSGDFELTLPEFSGPIELVVTAAGDGSSRMVCDAVDGCGSAEFGDRVPLPDDFRITTLITPGDEARESVAVTPLTHMAAEWTRDMPGKINRQRVNMARSRVAEMLDVDADFAFQRVPDLAGKESLESATAAERRHALMSASFAEVAADARMGIQETVDGFAKAFKSNGGQMMENGQLWSMYALYSRALQVADGRGMSEDLRNELSVRAGGLGKRMSAVSSRTDYETAPFDRAMASLNELDHYLTEAGIDSSGDFLAEQNKQVSWLYEPEMVQLYGYLTRAGRTAAVASVYAGMYEDDPDAPETLDLSILLQSEGQLSAIYDLDARRLTIRGAADGTEFDIRIDVTPVTGTERVLDFASKAYVANSTAIGSFSGSLKVDFHDSNIEPFISELHASLSGSGSTETLQSELEALIDRLHVRTSVAGDASLAKTGVQDFGFAVRNVSAWAELDIPALEQGGDVLALQVASTEITSPAGDRVSHSAGGNPAFALQVGEDAHLQTDLTTRAFGWPSMDIQLDGTLTGVAGLVRDAAAKFRDMDAANVQFEDVFNPLEALDYSLLGMNGDGSITVHDPDRGVKTFHFSLEDGEIEVSLPNSTEAAFTLDLTAPNGAMVYSGDTLVASVTFEWKELAATFHFVDGTKRKYALGPISDIVDPALVEFFLGAMT